MGITNAEIQYAVPYEINTDIGIITGPTAYWDSPTGTYYYNFIDSTFLKIKIPAQALHPTEYSIGNREVLYTYANGVRLCVTPWITTEHVSGVIEYDKYTYHAKFEYVTQEGRTIQLVGAGSELSYAWQSNDLGIREGWGVEYTYVPTVTVYSEISPPRIGDYPSYIFINGEGYFPKHFGVEDLYHIEYTLGELEDDYTRMGQLNVVGTDELYDDAVDAIERNGDGKPIHGNTDPQSQDPSKPDGNDGKYDPWNKGDTSRVPSLPTTDISATGMMTLYTPSYSQLRSLSNFLWSDEFIDVIKKLKNDPFESIIGLSMLPFAPDTSGTTDIIIGNCDSDVPAPLCRQFKQINCGAIKVSESWGSFLDYSPYTRIEIYLPFVGMRTLKTDDVMNKSVGVVYNIDCATGTAMCYVTADGNVMYTFNCDVAYHVPLTGSNMNELIKATVGLVGVAVGTGAVGGAVMASGGAITPMAEGVALGSIGASALSVVTSKEHSVVRSGAISGQSGILGDLIPYIVVHRPIQSLPANFGHFKGFMSSITNTLGGFSGYTEVAYAHLDGVTATDEEKNEIMNLLSQGVIV